MANKKVRNLDLRKDTWHLRMRVPTRYRQVESRSVIRRSLHTDSLAEAKDRIVDVRREVLSELDAKLAGLDFSRSETFATVANLARSRGLSYQAAEKLADGPLDEIMRRFSRLISEDPEAERSAEIASDLGGVSRPVVMLSGLVDEYEQSNRARLAKKTEDQKRRWRNPYKRAIRELLDVVSDKPATEVTRQDALLLESTYLDRVEEEEILADTANKSLGFLRTLMSAHCRRHQLDENLAFHRLVVRGGREPSKRREFSDQWIVDTLLVDNPLPGTNEEIRDVLIIMALSGGGPSEITGALPKHFRTEDEIPHIQLRNEGRTLKNPFRVRDLVLVGRALEAARRHPNGFTHYRGKAGFSDAANSFLRENGLLPSSEHTVYSLRHSFQGRMRRMKLDEFTQARMMGHSAKEELDRAAYGDDVTLEERLEATTAIMLPRASG